MSLEKLQKKKEFVFKKLEACNLNFVAEFIFSSQLGKMYYPNSSILKDKLKEGQTKEEKLYEIYIRNKFVGIIWFDGTGAFHQYPYLHMIILKDEMQSHGYGKKIMEFFEQDALNEQGKKIKTKVFLVVGTWNQKAENFYKKLGYEEIGVIPTLFRKKISEKLLMKECIRK